MSTHAFLPPSGAANWRFCSLWPTMVARYPETSGEEGAEGDAAHWCNVQATPPKVGERAPNGVAITHAMLTGRTLWHQTLQGQTGYAEAQIPSSNPRRGGTPDWWSFDGTTLTVADYKFGFGFVEVYECWQLIEYAALLKQALGLDDLAARVHFIIVQPRSFHRDGPVRHWRLDQLALLRGYWNQLDAAAEAATTPERIRGTVGPQCKHCPGRHACDALQRNTLVSVDMAGSSVPLDITPTGVGHELRALDAAVAMLKARQSGLQEQARAMLMAGKRVPFYAMQEGQGRTVWKVPPDQVKSIGQAFKLDLSKQEVITPTQAKAAGLPSTIVDSLSDWRPGALEVTEYDDASTQKLFGK